MKKEGLAKVKRDIATRVEDIKSDRKNLNKILDLLDELRNNLTREKAMKWNKLERGKRLAILTGLVDVMVHLISQGDVDNNKEEATETKLKSWIEERLEAFWNALLTILGWNLEEGDLGEFALIGAFKVIQALNMRRISITGEADESNANWSEVEVERFRSLVSALCSSEQDLKRIIKRFQEYVEYHDVKQHLVQALHKEMKKKSSLNTISASNIMSMLEILRFPTQVEVTKKLRTLFCRDSSNLFSFDYEATRRSFNEVWEGFFKLKFDTQLYKRILLLLPDHVMPFLTRPLLLTDFLINSYHVGGSISILALSGVFTLMQKYNLEYPDFYKKLYALLQPDVLSAKYRARFFYHLDIFMTSSHLPEYLVAAFVKRLARLSLYGPAETLQTVMAFITNLLLRHPGLIDKLISKHVTEFEDPYDLEELDLVKCKALESSLWEIVSLQNHILPQVAQSAKFISKKLPENEIILADHLEFKYMDMMQVESRKKIFVNVPCTFERPTGMKVPKMDLTDTIFSK